MTSLAEAPVHWLVNVPGSPGRVRTACGRFEWDNFGGNPVDEGRAAIYPVTCPGCLENMADAPVTVEAARD